MLRQMRSSAKFVFWIRDGSSAASSCSNRPALMAGAVTPTTAVANVNGTSILYTDWQRRTSQLMVSEQQQAGQSLSQDECSASRTRRSTTWFRHPAPAGVSSSGSR